MGATKLLATRQDVRSYVVTFESTSFQMAMHFVVQYAILSPFEMSAWDERKASKMVVGKTLFWGDVNKFFVRVMSGPVFLFEEAVLELHDTGRWGIWIVFYFIDWRRGLYFFYFLFTGKFMRWKFPSSITTNPGEVIAAAVMANLVWSGRQRWRFV